MQYEAVSTGISSSPAAATERFQHLAATNGRICPAPAERNATNNSNSAAEPRRDSSFANADPAPVRAEALLEHTSDMVLLLDADAVIVYASGAISGLLGFSPRSKIGVELVELVHPEDRDRLDRTYAGVLSRPGTSEPAVLRLAHATCGWRWMEIIANNCLHEPRVAGVVLTARDVEQRKSAEDALTKWALHDVLTGLPTRSLLLDRLDNAFERSRRRPCSLAVLFLDLDDFKSVNDSDPLHHEAGDGVLQGVAARLGSVVRPGDTLARYGGDEFVMICEGLDEPASATDIATRLLATLDDPIPIGSRQLRVTASIGIAAGGGHDGPRALLRAADAAMYEAKAEGGGRFQVAPLGR